MEDFSIDIIYEIFVCIRALGDAARFARTCRRMHEIWANYCRKLPYSYRTFYKVSRQIFGHDDCLALVHFSYGHNRALVISPCNSKICKSGSISGVKNTTSFYPVSLSDQIINHQSEQFSGPVLNYVFVELEENPHLTDNFPANQIIFIISVAKHTNTISVMGPTLPLLSFNAQTGARNVYYKPDLIKIIPLFRYVYEEFGLEEYPSLGPYFEAVIRFCTRPEFH